MQEGFYVDKEHLAEQDLKAQADLHDAGVRFRTWLRKYAAVIGQGNEEQGWHPDDIPGLVNLSSSAQIQTLLFGGFTASKDVLKKPTKAEAEAGMKEHMVKPTVESVRPSAERQLVPSAAGHFARLTCAVVPPRASLRFEAQECFGL